VLVVQGIKARNLIWEKSLPDRNIGSTVLSLAARNAPLFTRLGCRVNRENLPLQSIAMAVTATNMISLQPKNPVNSAGNY